MTQNGDAPTPFPRFDVVSDHSGHAYAAASNKKQNYDGSVHKTIMKEWRVLENNLPDSIYVRVYDTRIELLRAVIVGAAGTPYHDALFFFDVILLNTWIGKEREKWDPAQSTVFQVLLSIQALVLNEKPYFNEPGTGSPGGSGVEKRSRAYNEDAYVLTCKTTLYSLRNPPRNFEEFTAAFFRERGSRILRACGAYVNARAGVGYYRDEGELETSTKKPRAVWEVSKKFKASMQELYPQLVQVFKKNGALDLVEVLEVEAKTTPVKVEAKTKTVKVRVGKKAEIGIAKKVIGKLRKFLGLSKKKNQKMEKSDEKKDDNAGVAVGC
ncbi:hypothetical protein ACLB2K_039855 [Fragaria x ananassa]